MLGAVTPVQVFEDEAGGSQCQVLSGIQLGNLMKVGGERGGGQRETHRERKG